MKTDSRKAKKKKKKTSFFIFTSYALCVGCGPLREKVQKSEELAVNMSADCSIILQQNTSWTVHHFSLGIQSFSPKLHWSKASSV